MMNLMQTDNKRVMIALGDRIIIRSLYSGSFEDVFVDDFDGDNGNDCVGVGGGKSNTEESCSSINSTASVDLSDKITILQGPDKITRILYSNGILFSLHMNGTIIGWNIKSTEKLFTLSIEQYCLQLRDNESDLSIWSIAVERSSQDGLRLICGCNLRQVYVFYVDSSYHITLTDTITLNHNIPSISLAENSFFVVGSISGQVGLSSKGSFQVINNTRSPNWSSVVIDCNDIVFSSDGSCDFNSFSNDFSTNDFSNVRLKTINNTADEWQSSDDCFSETDSPQQCLSDFEGDFYFDIEDVSDSEAWIGGGDGDGVNCVNSADDVSSDDDGVNSANGNNSANSVNTSYESTIRYGNDPVIFYTDSERIVIVGSDTFITVMEPQQPLTAPVQIRLGMRRINCLLWLPDQSSLLVVDYYGMIRLIKVTHCNGGDGDGDCGGISAINTKTKTNTNTKTKRISFSLLEEIEFDDTIAGIIDYPSEDCKKRVIDILLKDQQRIARYFLS